MNTIKSKNFHVKLHQKKDRVLLTQQVYGQHLNTKTLPATYAILSKYLPTIFENECFNNEGLPFCEEVKQTEIGHLFEHMILEYIKLEKLNRFGEADVAGETSWDWTNGNEGLFKIEIDCHQDDNEYLTQALSKAARLLEEIYENQEAGNSVPLLLEKNRS